MNEIKLQITKESDNYDFVKVGQDYSLFVGIGQTQYYFTSSKKANKFLNSYTKALQTLIDDFSIYHTESYSLYVESLKYISHSDINKINQHFNNAVDSFKRLNSLHRSDTGFYIHCSNYTNSLIEVFSFYNQFYKKRRFNFLYKKSRVLLRSSEQSLSLIDKVVLNYKPFLTQINTQKLPLVTFGFNNQLKIVS